VHITHRSSYFYIFISDWNDRRKRYLLPVAFSITDIGLQWTKVARSF